MNIFTLSKAPLYLLISLFLPTMAMAIDPPERELSRFALKRITFSPLMKASMNWRLIMPVKRCLQQSPIV